LRMKKKHQFRLAVAALAWIVIGSADFSSLSAKTIERCGERREPLSCHRSEIGFYSSLAKSGDEEECECGGASGVGSGALMSTAYSSTPVLGGSASTGGSDSGGGAPGSSGAAGEGGGGGGRPGEGQIDGRSRVLGQPNGPAQALSPSEGWTTAINDWPPPAAPVPGPAVGSGLSGLVIACGGLLTLARRRRRQPATAGREVSRD
jgi:hypothetical protein